LICFLRISGYIDHPHRPGKIGHVRLNSFLTVLTDDVGGTVNVCIQHPAVIADIKSPLFPFPMKDGIRYRLPVLIGGNRIPGQAACTAGVAFLRVYYPDAGLLCLILQDPARIAS